MTEKQKIDTHRLTRIVPPIWLMLAMIVMYFLHGLVPLLYFVSDAIRPVGQVLILLGFTMVFFVARQFKRAQTPLALCRLRHS